MILRLTAAHTINPRHLVCVERLTTGCVRIMLTHKILGLTGDDANQAQTVISQLSVGNSRATVRRDAPRESSIL